MTHMCQEVCLFCVVCTWIDMFTYLHFWSLWAKGTVRLFLHCCFLCTFCFSHEICVQCPPGAHNCARVQQSPQGSSRIQTILPVCVDFLSCIFSCRFWPLDSVITNSVSSSYWPCWAPHESLFRLQAEPPTPAERELGYFRATLFPFLKN